MFEGQAAQAAFILFGVAVAVGALVLMARPLSSWLERSQALRSPWHRKEDEALLARLPVAERRRLNKLARSEERIDDPELSAKVAATCHLTLSRLDGQPSRRHWVLPTALILGLVFKLSAGAELSSLWVTIVSLLLVMAIPILLPRWVAAEKQRLLNTAEINNWTVGGTD